MNTYLLEIRHAVPWAHRLQNAHVVVPSPGGMSGFCGLQRMSPKYSHRIIPLLSEKENIARSEES